MPMKKLIMIFCLCIFVSFVSYAQQRNDLRVQQLKITSLGSKPKEEKHRLRVIEKSVKRSKGQNNKPWDKAKKPKDYIAVTISNQPKLQGPRAKNQKPWPIVEVDYKAISEAYLKKKAEEEERKHSKK